MPLVWRRRLRRVDGRDRAALKSNQKQRPLTGQAVVVSSATNMRIVSVLCSVREGVVHRAAQAREVELVGLDPSGVAYT